MINWPCQLTWSEPQGTQDTLLDTLSPSLLPALPSPSVKRNWKHFFCGKQFIIVLSRYFKRHKERRPLSVFNCFTVNFICKKRHSLHHEWRPLTQAYNTFFLTQIRLCWFDEYIILKIKSCSVWNVAIVNDCQDALSHWTVACAVSSPADIHFCWQPLPKMPLSPILLDIFL